MNHEEDRMQAECFQWLHNEHPETRGCFFHVPNESGGGAREGAIRKAKGVVSGVPDNVFLWKGAVHLIELKTEKGSLSDRQKEVFPALERQGFPVVVIRSFEEFKEYVLARL